jgi:hypothetical protein
MLAHALMLADALMQAYALMQVSVDGRDAFYNCINEQLSAEPRWAKF